MANENNSRVSPITTGAMIAFAVAAAWILQYLAMTSYGSSSQFGYSGNLLLNYVTGQAYGDAFESASALTVTFLRFVLAFGFVWPFATFIVSLINKVASKPVTTS